MNRLLRYSHPAYEFKNGLPIGNGRLAAMICGDDKNIRIALNHEWLWRGDNRFRDADDVSSHLPEVRELILKGDFLKATELANEYFAGLGGISSVKNRVDPYQPAGDLTVFTDGGEYQRTLDLSTGEAVVSIGSTGFRIFADFNTGFIVMKLSGDYSLSLSRVDDPMCDVRIEGLSLSGLFTSGISFEVKAREYPCDGYVTVLLDIATNANGSKIMDFPEDADYDKMFALHCPKFKEALGPSSVELKCDIPDKDTDVRIKDFKEGRDNAFPLLYFEYGRYLIVSGSSGRLPLNLQGKWNEDLLPPWDCDYHLDINIQMAYWAAPALGLFRQEETFFNLCERYIPHGREMAKKLYGCRGVYFTLQTDVWGRMTPESKGWAVWIGAAPWMATHFVRYWKYTLDEDFLVNRAYPFLKDIAAFYRDYLVKIDGVYHVLPSQSPENRFEGTGIYPVSIGIDSAMDLELARITLGNCIEISEYLDVDAGEREIWRELIENLAPLSVDSVGRLNEFDRERKEPEPGHRHLSHLFGLYPGELFAEGDPLRIACEKSLDYRLSFGGGHTGWSRSWVACLMARLGRKEEGWKHLKALICDFATESLLDLHPPRIFQIDGNLGGTAAIIEMLLSCERNVVTILKGLPSEWDSGRFSHLIAPGTLDVSAEWINGEAVKVELKAKKAGNWILKVNDKTLSITLPDNGSKTFIFC